MACSALLITSVGTASARAEPHTLEDLYRNGDIVVDHPPHPYGGFASDTAYTYTGDLRWQRVADDILLTEAATIRHITWWGFYGSSMAEEPQPAPETETMRIRFYHARPGDGLPDDDNILYEESFLNPSRTATGTVIWVPPPPGPLEYIYEADFEEPVLLDADTPYWVEIVQSGDIESLFRWEFSVAELTGVAVINPGHDWERTTSMITDNAFQLSTIPEPSAVGLVGLGVFISCLRSGGRRRCRGSSTCIVT